MTSALQIFLICVIFVQNLVSLTLLYYKLRGNLRGKGFFTLYPLSLTLCQCLKERLFSGQWSDKNSYDWFTFSVTNHSHSKFFDTAGLWLTVLEEYEYFKSEFKQNSEVLLERNLKHNYTLKKYSNQF